MENGKIRAWSIIRTRPDSSDSAVTVMDSTLEKCGLSLKDIAYVVSTGYGRVNVPFSQATITEISCHAKGTNWFFPEVRTILDMGGQDCKAIRCDEKGRVREFVMNDKCAAGTGRYLERAAATLNLDLDQIGPLSLEPKEGPLHVSEFCAVFAERDINVLMRGANNLNDILAGVHDAIARRVRILLKQVGVEEELSISGGVAKNIGVLKRLEEEFGLKAMIAPEPQIVGAIGASLFARDRAAMACSHSRAS